MDGQEGIYRDLRTDEQTGTDLFFSVGFSVLLPPLLLGGAAEAKTSGADANHRRDAEQRQRNQQNTADL